MRFFTEIVTKLGDSPTDNDKIVAEFLTNFITKHVAIVGDKLFTKFGEDIGEPLHFSRNMSLHSSPNLVNAPDSSPNLVKKLASH